MDTEYPIKLTQSCHTTVSICKRNKCNYTQSIFYLMKTSNPPQSINRIFCLALSEVPVLKMISLKLKITHKLHRFYSLSTLKESNAPVLYKTYSSSCTRLLVGTNGPATDMSFGNMEELNFFYSCRRQAAYTNAKTTQKKRFRVVGYMNTLCSPALAVASSRSNRKTPEMTLVLLNPHASSSLCYGHLLTQRLRLQPVFNGSTQPFPPLN